MEKLAKLGFTLEEYARCVDDDEGETCDLSTIVFDKLPVNWFDGETEKFSLVLTKEEYELLSTYKEKGFSHVKFTEKTNGKRTLFFRGGSKSYFLHKKVENMFLFMELGKEENIDFLLSCEVEQIEK